MDPETEAANMNYNKRKNLKPKAFQLKDLFNFENFIISQDSFWKKIFDTAILLVIGYSCATTVF